MKSTPLLKKRISFQNIDYDSEGEVVKKEKELKPRPVFKRKNEKPNPVTDTPEPKVAKRKIVTTQPLNEVVPVQTISATDPTSQFVFSENELEICRDLAANEQGGSILDENFDLKEYLEKCGQSIDFIRTFPIPSLSNADGKLSEEEIANYMDYQYKRSAYMRSVVVKHIRDTANALEANPLPLEFLCRPRVFKAGERDILEPQSTPHTEPIIDHGPCNMRPTSWWNAGPQIRTIKKQLKPEFDAIDSQYTGTLTSREKVEKKMKKDDLFWKAVIEHEANVAPKWIADIQDQNTNIMRSLNEVANYGTIFFKKEVENLENTIAWYKTEASYRSLSAEEINGFKSTVVEKIRYQNTLDEIIKQSQNVKSKLTEFTNTQQSIGRKVRRTTSQLAHKELYSDFDFLTQTEKKRQSHASDGSKKRKGRKPKSKSNETSDDKPSEETGTVSEIDASECETMSGLDYMSQISDTESIFSSKD
jgi:hypothetical protein